MFRTCTLPPGDSLDAIRRLPIGSRIVDPALGDDMILTFEALRRIGNRGRRASKLRPLGHLLPFLECVRDGPEELIKHVGAIVAGEEGVESLKQTYATGIAFRKQAALYLIRCIASVGYSVSLESLDHLELENRRIPALSAAAADIRKASKLLQGVMFVKDCQRIPRFAVGVCDLRKHRYTGEFTKNCIIVCGTEGTR